MGMTEKERQEYLARLYNPENILRCDGCPENRGESWNCLPCGQQHCVVDVHCNPEDYGRKAT
jgi:hypothetical protein